MEQFQEYFLHENLLPKDWCSVAEASYWNDKHGVFFMRKNFLVEYRGQMTVSADLNGDREACSGWQKIVRMFECHFADMLESKLNMDVSAVELSGVAFEDVKVLCGERIQAVVRVKQSDVAKQKWCLDVCVSIFH